MLGYEVDHSPPALKINKVWSYTSTLCDVVMAFCLVKHGQKKNISVFCTWRSSSAGGRAVVVCETNVFTFQITIAVHYLPLNFYTHLLECAFKHF